MYIYYCDMAVPQKSIGCVEPLVLESKCILFVIKKCHDF